VTSAHKRTLATLALAVAVVLSFFGPGLARADGDGSVRLEIHLTGKVTEKPIRDATIYIKFKESRRLRKDKQREWNVKTNRDGRAVINGLPEGAVLVQIVVPGWRTYGKFHEIKSPKHKLEIELEKPPKWF
jgi:hypothetical protein